jgi:hypothetical protein
LWVWAPRHGVAEMFAYDLCAHLTPPFARRIRRETSDEARCATK